MMLPLLRLLLLVVLQVLGPANRPQQHAKRAALLSNSSVSSRLSRRPMSPTIAPSHRSFHAPVATFQGSRFQTRLLLSLSAVPDDEGTGHLITLIPLAESKCPRTRILQFAPIQWANQSSQTLSRIFRIPSVGTPETSISLSFQIVPARTLVTKVL